MYYRILAGKQLFIIVFPRKLQVVKNQCAMQIHQLILMTNVILEVGLTVQNCSKGGG